MKHPHPPQCNAGVEQGGARGGRIFGRHSGVALEEWHIIAVTVLPTTSTEGTRQSNKLQ